LKRGGCPFLHLQPL